MSEGEAGAALKTEPGFSCNMIQITPLRRVENSGASTIIHTENKETWVYQNKRITIYSDEFKILKTIDLDWNMSDMTPMPSPNDIIATDTENCRINKISRDGEVTALYNVWVSVGGVCINDAKDAVVGLYNKQALPYVNLGIYSSDASFNIMKIENFTGEKKLLKGMISKVKQNSNGDYVVSDLDKIVCVNRKCEFRWHYCADDKVYGLVCDQYSNVILAEYFNKRITLLDKDGSFVQTLLTAEDGIEMPSSLSIDWYGNLWVGQYDDMKIFKYIK